MWESIVFVQKFFDLIAYCEMLSFNDTTFKSMSDEYAKKYAKLNQSDQGFITEQINIRYKDAE